MPRSWRSASDPHLVRLLAYFVEIYIKNYPFVRLFDGTKVDDASVEEQITASPEFRESRVLKSSVSKADEGVYQCETGNVYGSGVAKFSQVQVITRTTVNIVNSAAGLEG